MTTNQTIDGVLVPRELLVRLNNLIRWNFGNEPECVELRALLAAPVVERQEPACYVVKDRWGVNTYLEENSEALKTRRRLGFTDEIPLYTSPPAPVAVQLDERTEFEKWLRNQPHVVNLGFNKATGKYVLQEDEDSWQAWKARACLDKVKELNQ